MKGCLTAREVASALKDGLLSVWTNARVRLFPLSDGGEGLLDVIAFHSGGRFENATVCGPYGEPLQAAYWISDDGRTAFVETARASGLSRSPLRDPFRATSFGTGELCALALKSGVSQIYLGAGGSAFTDGGAGALQALGFKLLDANGHPIPHGASGLLQIDRIEPPETQNAKNAKISVICDVLNPLLGPDGAARCFGPQKGATPEQMPLLEEALSRWARALERSFGKNPADLEHGGACGGLASGFAVALNAPLLSGAAFVAQWTQFEAALNASQLVLTAEGQVDHQSRFGKTTWYALQQAERAMKPSWLFAGRITAQGEATYLQQFAHASLFCLPDGPISLEESMARAPELLRRAAARAAHCCFVQEQDPKP